ELAVQAANDTNSTSDRASLQAEVNQLKSEIDRIASTTSFNNQKILDGSFTAKQFQVGSNAEETIGVSISNMGISHIGTYSITPVNSLPMQGAGSASAAFPSQPPWSPIESQDLTISGPDGTGVVQIARPGYYWATNIEHGTNKLTETTGVHADASNKATIRNLSEGGRITVTVGINSSRVTVEAEVEKNDLSNLVDAINAVSEKTTVVAHDNGSSFTMETERGIDIGFCDFIHHDSSGATIEVAGIDQNYVELRDGGSDSTRVSGYIEFYSKCKPFQLSSNIDAGSGSILDTIANSIVISPIESVAEIDISSFDGAQRALKVCDGALCQINGERAGLGAIQNRFESTMSNLQNISENLAAARSRILDADIAAETSNLTKQNILQQAGVSILSQANQQPQLALSLLGNL
ncbi:MAG: flagellin, partial [Desulfobulbaceae bacterium]|nr:flagellin [Desulfobulbaceae bacterium]